MRWRLNRKQKIVRNLAVAALALFLAAWMLEFPAWTKAGLLRRAERQYLLEGSEFLFVGDEGGPATLYAQNGNQLLAVIYSRTPLGLQMNWSHLFSEPDGIYCDANDWDQTEFIAIGNLEEMATAELEVTLDITVGGVNELHETYTAQGVRVNPHCFRFTLERHHDESSDDGVAARAEYRIFEQGTAPHAIDPVMRFYDAEGELLHEKDISGYEIEMLGW